MKKINFKIWFFIHLGFGTEDNKALVNKALVNKLPCYPLILALKVRNFFAL